MAEPTVLYNKTGERLEVHPDDVQKALAQGYRYPVTMTDPEGVQQEVHPDDAAKALKLGWIVGQPQTSVEKTSPYNKVQLVASSAAGTGAERMGIPQSQTPVRDTIQQLTDSTTPYAIGAQASPIKVPAFLANFIGSMGQAQGEQFGKAKDELKNAKDVATDKNLTPWQRVKGAVSNAMLAETHAKAGLVPFAGPATANAGEDWKQVYDNPNPENVGNAIGGTGAAVAQAMMLRGGAKPEGIKPTKILSQGEVNPGVAIEKTANLIKKYTGDVNVNPKALAQARGEGVPPVIQVEKGKIPSAVASGTRKVAAAVAPEKYMTAEQAATKAFRPRNSKTNWKQDVTSAMPDARRAADNLGLNPDKMTLDDALAATQQAKADIWTEYTQNHLEPASNMKASTDPVSSAMVGTITKRMREQNPRMAAAIEEAAKTYAGREISVPELQQRVSELNNELRSIEAKYLTDKKAAKLDPHNAYKFAERDTLRSLLDQKLQDATGEGGAALRKRWGALASMEDVISRRIPVAGRANPVSLTHLLGDLGGYSTIAMGAVHGNVPMVAAGIAAKLAARQAERLNNPEFLTQLAFKKTTPTGAPAVMGEYVPPANTSPVGLPMNRQLPAGNIPQLPAASGVQAPTSPAKPPFLLNAGNPYEMPASQIPQPEPQAPQLPWGPRPAPASRQLPDSSQVPIQLPETMPNPNLVDNVGGRVSDAQAAAQQVAKKKPVSKAEVPKQDRVLTLYRGEQDGGTPSASGTRYFSDNPDYAAKYGTVRAEKVDTSNFFDPRRPEHASILDTINNRREPGYHILTDPVNGLPLWSDAGKLQDALVGSGKQFDGLILSENVAPFGHGGVSYAQFKNQPIPKPAPKPSTSEASAVQKPKSVKPPVGSAHPEIQAKIDSAAEASSKMSESEYNQSGFDKIMSYEIARNAAADRGLVERPPYVSPLDPVARLQKQMGDLAGAYKAVADIREKAAKNTQQQSPSVQPVSKPRTPVKVTEEKVQNPNEPHDVGSTVYLNDYTNPYHGKKVVVNGYETSGTMNEMGVRHRVARVSLAENGRNLGTYHPESLSKNAPESADILRNRVAEKDTAADRARVERRLANGEYVHPDLVAKYPDIAAKYKASEPMELSDVTRDEWNQIFSDEYKRLTGKTMDEKIVDRVRAQARESIPYKKADALETARKQANGTAGDKYKSPSPSVQKEVGKSGLKLSTSKDSYGQERTRISDGSRGFIEVIDKGDTLHVDEINVKREFRRQGIGTTLYKKAIELAKIKGKKYIESGWSVSDDAAKVWRSLGAEEFKETPSSSPRFRLKIQ